MDKYCRLCLSKVHQYKKSPEFALIVDLSLEYFGVKLNSILPAYVCQICETKIISFHEFRGEVVRCQEMLLYELQIEEKIVNFSDGSVDGISDELEKDPIKLSDEDVLDLDSCRAPLPKKELLKTKQRPLKTQNKDSCLEKFPFDIPQEIISCDICPKNKKTFTNIFGLRRHKMYYHSTNPKKYFRTCDQCNRSFKNQNLLNCHKRYDHMFKRQLTCTQCEKFFKNDITLRNHIKTFHGEEKLVFECELCKKTFGRKDALLEHQTIHTGERPYKCLWCPKTFRNSSHFSTHRSISHNVEYLKWKKERYKF